MPFCSQCGQEYALGGERSARDLKEGGNADAGSNC